MHSCISRKKMYVHACVCCYQHVGCACHLEHGKSRATHTCITRDACISCLHACDVQGKPTGAIPLAVITQISPLSKKDGYDMTCVHVTYVWIVSPVCRVSCVMRFAMLRLLLHAYVSISRRSSPLGCADACRHTPCSNVDVAHS